MNKRQMLSWIYDEEHTVIKALATPVAKERRYIKLWILLGRRKIPAPETIQSMAPTV